MCYALFLQYIFNVQSPRITDDEAVFQLPHHVAVKAAEFCSCNITLRMHVRCFRTSVMPFNPFSGHCTFHKAVTLIIS